MDNNTRKAIKEALQSCNTAGDLIGVIQKYFDTSKELSKMKKWQISLYGPAFMDGLPEKSGVSIPPVYKG